MLRSRHLLPMLHSNIHYLHRLIHKHYQAVPDHFGLYLRVLHCQKMKLRHSHQKDNKLDLKEFE